MNIKEASQKAGISEDMLRHYEKLGIVAPKRKPSNNYRSYSEADLYTIVMAKQYSELGISLKTVAEMIYSGSSDAMLEEMNHAVASLQHDLDFARSRLLNAYDFQKTFNMIHKNEDFMVLTIPRTYYYRRKEKETASLYAKLYNHAGAVKTVLRIANKNVNRKEYPLNQGMLAVRKLDDPSLEYLVYPSHRVYRTLRQVRSSPILNYQTIQPILKEIKKNGYSLEGDILVSQIIPADKKNEKITICIDCDIGRSES